MFNISKRLPKKMALGLIAGLIGASVALIFYLSGALNLWENKTWDWRVDAMAREAEATDKILLIFLDQDSLDWVEKEYSLSWPWPREVYSVIIQFCRRSGARSLAFDVIFTEASGYGVDDDEVFASAIKDFKRFVAPVFLSHDSGSEDRWPAYASEPEFKILGLDSWLSAEGESEIVFNHASFPVSEISAASSILADVQYNPDQDNVYRRAALFHVFDGRLLPSLALGSYMASKPDTLMEINPEYLIIDDRKIPIDKQGEAIINFRGPSGTHKAYSAAAVIQSELRMQNGTQPSIEPEELQDAHVFFGFSAPGLYDLRPTPVSGIYPGVEINATMLDNLLSGDFIRSFPPAAVIVITLLIALFAGLTTSSVTGIIRSSLVYIFFIVAPIILCLLAYQKDLWLPVVVQEIAVVFTLFLSGLIYYTTEGRQKMFIKNAFRQYLSPAVIEQLIKRPENLKLGGERRMLSMFFSDLEGFTGISEGLDPETLTSLLNDYLSAMTDIIHEEGGTIDKYEGDAIIALWNAPVLQPNHSVRCVRASLRCQERLAEMRPMFRERLGKELKMRIGINSGPAIVGNMGSRTRFDYTMIGDAVNLASRLEGINKQFGTYTIISQSTMELMENAFPVRELSKVAVVGRKEPVVIYEPMLRDEFEGRKQHLARFAQGLDLFYMGNFSEAEVIFKELGEDDPAARSYIAKCRELLENPPSDWQGVWVITEK